MPQKGISVKVRGIGKARKAFDRLSAIAPEKAIDGLNVSGLAVQRLAKKNLTQLGGVDTGLLRTSVKMLKARLNKMRVEVFTNAAYGVVVERGRAPGEKAPPADAIKPWLKRQGMDEGLAFVIARSIGEKGTAARPYMFPAWEQERGNLTKNLKTALRAAIKEAMVKRQGSGN